MNSRLRRYLTAIDLDDMDYFYDWWGKCNTTSWLDKKAVEAKYRSRIRRLHFNG